MEEEIDLRPYIEALINQWYWLVGAGLVAAIVAFIISSLLPPTYEATALVAVTETRQRIVFDPRIQTQEEQQPLQAFPQLATSDELVRQLFTQLALPQSELASVQDLRKRLTAQSGSDPSLIELTASFQDAETASHIANAWANIFVAWANEIYRNSNGEQLAFYENQLDVSATELALAEEALVTFQARNRSSIVQNRLLALNLVQEQYLADLRQTTFLLQDIASLQTQLALQTSPDVTWADQLTVLNLQLQAFGTQAVGENDRSSTLQLQVAPETTLTSASRREQLAYLDGLRTTLDGRLVALEDSLAALEPEILALQQEQQVLQAEFNRLQRNVTVAEETYTALARKVDEERITSQDQISSLRLASNSTVPDEPTAPRRLLITLVAGFLGGILMVMILLVRQWWQTMAVEPIARETA